MIKIYSAKINDFTQADYAKMYSLLERAVRDKIDAKKCEKAKKQSLAGYILLYKAVFENFKKTEFKIFFNTHGKPLCDFCYFSISHSDEQVVCCVSDQPVGIDIQKKVEITPRKKYKFFNEKECFYVNQDEDLLSSRYIEVFTKKEAAIKLMGASLSSAALIDTFSNDFCFETKTVDENFLTVCSKSQKIM